MELSEAKVNATLLKIGATLEAKRTPSSLPSSLGA
jgi:hypothetical protein